jgi:methyl-accepting chemotaxis protein
VKKAADMIRNVAAGTGASDFTARLPVHGSDEMGEMAAGLNELMGRIEGAVSGMKGTAACVDRSSRDVSCCADDLMNLLLDQAASVEAVAQTIEEMTAFIKQNAVSAESGRDKTRSMVIMAGRSELSMRSLVEAMDGISLASKKIGDIISTVNEVAFQTNLLALNAAVEAARAGEHGRGFAVVAGEVRALARRSAEAAGEIRRLIEDTVTRIRTGDELAKNAEKSISGIIEGINDLSETIEEFASTSSEQAGGVDDLNRSVQRMDIVTQKNAAAIHQLSDSAESMLSSAGTLAGDVARFNPTKSRKHTSGLRRERKESETGEVE